MEQTLDREDDSRILAYFRPELIREMGALRSSSHVKVGPRKAEHLNSSSCATATSIESLTHPGCTLNQIRND